MSEDSYFSNLSTSFGRGWNRFWFSPSDAYSLSVLRILTGILGLYFVVSHSADLVTWFGASGLLPVNVVKQLTGATASGPDAPSVFHLSWFDFFNEPSMLWILHVAGLIVLAMFTLGFKTRITSIVSLIVVLCYLHRAPMVTGQFEPILTMLLLYLCIGPCGAYLSLDSLLAKRQGEFAPPEPSVAATVSTRLIQVHLAGLYFMFGVSKLAGDTWWMGEAVWWLIAHTESRLVDLTFLHTDRLFYCVNLWTHAIVIFELVFGLLVWNRLARPLLLGFAVLMWTSLALITGMIAFSAVMLVANLAFVDPDGMRRLMGVCTGGKFGRPHATAITKPAV